MDGRHSESRAFRRPFRRARPCRGEGEPVEVSVDTSSMHFFDPETGLGIYDQEQGKGKARHTLIGFRSATVCLVVAAAVLAALEQRLRSDEGHEPRSLGQHHVRRGLDRKPRRRHFLAM